MVEHKGNEDKSLKIWIWDATCTIRETQEAAKYLEPQGGDQ
ncbi:MULTISPECIES: hypothetical protein [unclassified Nostoc]|nr:hypothetical protein [Nostoc sp. DedQUE03]MDZ7974774.1 hypothetical protein [Nostoc sp. DedQUE03]MDZ8049448.1 hypothetical protein [Nostoc sp. DedQUE02]